MISETTFAKRFTSFWNELLPNAKNYVRLVNAGGKEITHKPLPTPERRQNTALVNTLSFGLYLFLCANKVEVAAIFAPTFLDSSEFKGILQTSIDHQKRYGTDVAHTLPLTNSELQQAQLIAKILYARYHIALNPQLEPPFDGCGFLNSARGDIFLQGRLVEIKSGERTFSVQDFRQILIYCMLNHFGRHPLAISRIELFNPRMGILYSASITEFTTNLSSLEPFQLFAELASFASDTNFVELADI